MAEKTLTVTGTGDSLFVAPFPAEYAPMLDKLAGFIGGCDVRMTNLETNLTDFEYFGNAYSGGTWLSTRRKYMDDLTRFGFNFYGNANNHALDYAHAGLLSTVAELDARKLAHAGTGRSLEEAAAPAILNANGRERIDGYYAPPDLWNKNRDTGRSTAEIFADYGIPLIKTSNERVQGWLDVKEWIRPIEETNEQTGAKKLTSRLQVLNGAAPNLCRCMKAIQKDEKKPNDCANDPHELTHAPDSLRAFCAGRPQPPEVPTIRDPDEPRTYNEQINDFMSWGTF